MHFTDLIFNLFDRWTPFIARHQFFISFTSIIIALIFSFLLIRMEKKQKPILINEDMTMLAGEDVITSQLDLARAYLEMGKSDLAKPILSAVKQQGNPQQKKEASQLSEML